MSTNVSLTGELENFAEDCVQNGRYASVSEVVRAGLRLLKDSEERRVAFNKMLAASEAEAERFGSHDIDAVAAEIDAIISSAGK